MATRPPSMVRALEESLRAQPPEAADRAAVVLAKHYACLIDEDPAALLKIGHLVLPALSALGLTPAARGALVAKGAAGNASVTSRVDELRERRRTRADRAAAVDSAAP